jgi:uncharacterized membrane protein (DUF2068 family)
MESQKHRPSDVTTTAILTIVGGIAFLAIGISMALILLGFAYFVMAYGLLKGKRWAWTITLILSVIGIILSISTIFVRANVGAIIHITINAVVIYYLYRPNVKAFFGK